MAPAKFQPAVLGGVTIGVLSALPVVGCCCCVWMLFGGAMAAYFMQQNHPDPIEVGDGAIVGLLAGAIGAAVWPIVAIPINTAMAPISGELFQQALRDSADMPPWLRDALERGPRGAGFGIGTLFSFLLMLILMTTLGMLGGIFGALMFRKNQTPVVPPPIPQ